MGSSHGEFSWRIAMERCGYHARVMLMPWICHTYAISMAVSNFSCLALAGPLPGTGFLERKIPWIQYICVSGKLIRIETPGDTWRLRWRQR